MHYDMHCLPAGKVRRQISFTTHSFGIENCFKLLRVRVGPPIDPKVNSMSAFVVGFFVGFLFHFWHSLAKYRVGEGGLVSTSTPKERNSLCKEIVNHAVNRKYEDGALP